MELFTHVNLLVAQGRNLDIITQAETIRPYDASTGEGGQSAYA